MAALLVLASFGSVAAQVLGDVNGNGNSTPERQIIVADMEPPTFEVITRLPDQVGTGEMYSMIVDAFDNYGIWKVDIVMTADPPGEVLMNTTVYTIHMGGNEYMGMVNIPTSFLETITYWVRVEDLNGNNVTGEKMTTQMVDVLPPDVEPIDPFIVDPGEVFELTVEAMDNIGVTGYRWEGLPFDAESASIKGRIDEEGVHVIRVIVTDAAGNEAVEEFEVLVLSEEGVSPGSMILAVVLVIGVVIALVVFVKRKGRRAQSEDLHLGPADEGLQ